MNNPGYTGWPTTSGPLYTLQTLGLIDPDAPQHWAPFQKVYLHRRGHVVYKATARFLKSPAIRNLAALTLEGYEVHLEQSTTSGDIEMRIKATR